MLSVLVVWLPSLDVCNCWRMFHVYGDYLFVYYWNSLLELWLYNIWTTKRMCGVTRRGSVLCLESERIPNPCAINYFELDSQLFSLEVNLEFGLIEKWQRLKCGGKWDSLCATFIIISFFCYCNIHGWNTILITCYYLKWTGWIVGEDLFLIRRAKPFKQIIQTQGKLGRSFHAVHFRKGWMRGSH